MPLYPFLRRLALCLAGLIASGIALPTTTWSSSQIDRTELHREIRSYLLEHPEVITEAIDVLRARQAEQAETELRSVLEARRPELVASTADPVLGNAKGDVTIVSFSDYQCGYCKRMLKPLMEVLKQDPNVRIVFKELPVLGPMSTNAAEAALAAHMQGKYRSFYTAMMEHRGALTEAIIRDTAQKAGLDMKRLDRDIKQKSIAGTLEKNIALATALGIRGTPAFVVGDRILPGAVDTNTLMTAIKSAREAS